MITKGTGTTLAASNLRGYYTFEASDGADTSGTNGPTFTVNGDSSIVSV